MNETPATDHRSRVEPATPDEPMRGQRRADRGPDPDVGASPHPYRRRARRLLLATVLVAGVDLLTKLWAATVLRAQDVELPGPLDLRLSHNSGAAFGAFADLPAALTVAVTAVVTVGLVVAGVRGVIAPIPCALIAGGALGNVIDRAHGGSVVDLLHTGWWPTFNFADVFITIGAVMLVAGAFRTAASRPGHSPGPR